MPRKQCYWTRKLELELVDFIRRREFIWRTLGNTNHHIQQKYKAYAEFASRLGRGFTARSVRDRWVNIRSTYNHIVRRIEKSKETAQSESDVYVPCWPLWKPMQFLRYGARKEEGYEAYTSLASNTETSIDTSLKAEFPTNDTEDFNCYSKTNEQNCLVNTIESEDLPLRQRGERTNRPRKRLKFDFKTPKRKKCKRLVNDLVRALRPVSTLEDSQSYMNGESENGEKYWFFGKHVTEQLNRMRPEDAECASQEILRVLEDISEEGIT